MNILIRNEELKDYRRVEEVARKAFWNLYCPGTDIHYVVNKMRSHKDFIKKLAFVIEVNGIIEGAIFYTHAKIVSANGTEYKVISLGPAFISPKFHRKGLGKGLISYSIEKAQKLGYNAILTLGYPYHYKPYGFLGGKKYEISMSDMNFYIGLLVLPLYDGALKNISGYAALSEVFEVLPEELEKIEEFDKNFESKDKKIQDSQKEFQLVSIKLDEEIY